MSEINVSEVSVTDTHKRIAAFIKGEVGKGPSPAVVAVVLNGQAAYKKSDQYVAEKSAAAKAREDAARARYDKHQAAAAAAAQKAAEIAERYGFGQPDPEFTVTNPEPAAEPEPEVIPPPPAKRTRGPKLAAVPDVEDTTVPDPENDTSAIVVDQSEDLFAEVGAEDGEDDDFFDEGEEDEEEY